MKSRSGLGAYFESRALRVEPSKHEVFKMRGSPNCFALVMVFAAADQRAKLTITKTITFVTKVFCQAFFQKSRVTPSDHLTNLISLNYLASNISKFSRLVYQLTSREAYRSFRGWCTNLLREKHVEVFEVGTEFL